MQIREAFQAATKANKFGVEGYYVENKYFDPKQQGFGSERSAKKLETKKGCYIDDYIALHGKIPGPGFYQYTTRGSEYQKSSKSQKISIPDKKTFIDEIIAREKKEKPPAPGQYQPKTKKRPSSATHRKPAKITERATYLDVAQFEASKSPGVGSYNPRPQSAKVSGNSRMKPQDWIKKHKQREKSLSLRKNGPESATYNPKLIEKKNFGKLSKGKSTFGNTQRFQEKKQFNDLGPGKYQAHSEWGKKILGEGSRIKASSVYYQ